MDINKVDLLLKYIPAAAGQEDYSNRRMVDIAGRAMPLQKIMSSHA